MTASADHRIRHKAVWGSRVVLAALALLLLGFAPSASAASRPSHAPKVAAPSRHQRQAPKAKPGRPNANAKAYKLDHELTQRAKNAHSTLTTQVLVRLQPKAALPQNFRRYARNGKLLRSINAYALELPDSLLAPFCANPAVLSCHFDRPAAKFNYRT